MGYIKNLKLNWERGNNCYFTRTKEGNFYFNDCGTLSFSQDNNSPEEFICKCETLQEADRETFAILDEEE